MSDVNKWNDKIEAAKRAIAKAGDIPVIKEMLHKVVEYLEADDKSLGFQMGPINLVIHRVAETVVDNTSDAIAKEYQYKAQADIRDAWHQYLGIVDEKAKTVFKKVILPFCRRRGWRFLKDGHDWVLYPPNEAGIVSAKSRPDDRELVAVCALLDMRVLGISDNPLAVFMPDVRDPTYLEEE